VRKVKRTPEASGLMRGLMLLPCRPDVCQECAVDHPVDHPHNAGSMYYQYRFRAKHKRWPTWEDAMAHCSEDVKSKVREVIAK
jgi:hypothetical protein